MQVLSFRGPQLFPADAQALLNGLARAASHLVAARVERIANACDVAGLLAARRARRVAGEELFRAAGREGRRLRRGGLFGCFHYLSELS
ncbi:MULTISPECIES: hypothetical protein [unclassified Bradyrhizobium]|uniref:hypothetical protein n=1 Tax=unclassified Bradyrhizobium TaxID=2631580 RepID=UPI0024E12038|nr:MULTISPECIES: hypothetical protein [unclassified Bradyrhizobium]